ncbi:MAG: SMC-Scp complex subunit ScpB [Hyphomicrobiaceae bacterium]|nr:MAG: SMC-Scp complex subunit ScpB [Hyphomicrobiaceae bacterium]
MGEPRLKRSEPELEAPHLTVVPEARDATEPPSRAPLRPEEQAQKLRVLEALLFAASEPLDERTLGGHLDSSDDVAALLGALARTYSGRGVNLVRVAGKWQFRTADDLSHLLEKYAVEERRLSKAALETLSIIAYHQPVTRAEIEEIRGVQCSPGTLDALLETGWIRMRGRRRAPGRPVTYGTSEGFLTHFGFESIKDLPGLAELKGAGLLDSNLPPDFAVPDPRDVAALTPDEDPLEDEAGEDPQLDLLADAEGPDKETPEGDPPAG